MRRASRLSDVDGIQGEELTLNAAGFPTDVTNLDASGGHERDNNGVMRLCPDAGRVTTGW